ncbi:GNAT family N-acetyltransferase [Marinomonas transparens]|uniref:GNAT family N-acetyltransferase n=1 Tax=Marinomonas transparens TaxID=2795388 RepID=A0A934JTI3_9GAMM|nr:GNAT family N-acetyltransferase [Marinomonas transparens]MBJ7539684.1 GNAT family N-acetyltransferase [Marinomonas transparens]
MLIRNAKIQDTQAIARVAEALGYKKTQESQSDGIFHQRLTHLLDSINDQVWVAELDGQVIGWLHAQHAYRAASADFIEILGLSVDSNARQQGGGRALVEKAKHWAETENITLRVRTNETREVAKAFYAALGFSLSKKQAVFEAGA